MFSIFKSMLCALLCYFCDCCDGECPDGVCNTGQLREAVEELRVGAPDVSATQPQSVSLDWAELQPTIDAVLAAVRQIMRLFGISPKVG